ncbi:hypothetical protein BKA58DRAFT_214377 [Alternaria rosae]|uniref:uncharacterized protein n=1 Tax=Alternaria rosae TaxID=1187941 RepID=UPI001E8CD548|nr:uncharacterized protein BKA58DRAFT_214377 [Alternaria rosae]KAH6866918.1 hypothetical protein BKA58DRAFT_214377 [Alternaria rosae]
MARINNMLLMARLPFLFLYHQTDGLHQLDTYHAAIAVASIVQTGLEVPAACATFRVSTQTLASSTKQTHVWRDPMKLIQYPENRSWCTTWSQIGDRSPWYRDRAGHVWYGKVAVGVLSTNRISW